jgi:hypothetical protein
MLAPFDSPYTGPGHRQINRILPVSLAPNATVVRKTLRIFAIFAPNDKGEPLIS